MPQLDLTVNLIHRYPPTQQAWPSCTPFISPTDGKKHRLCCNLCHMANQPKMASDLNKAKWVAVGKVSIYSFSLNNGNNHGGHFTCIKKCLTGSDPCSQRSPVTAKAFRLQAFGGQGLYVIHHIELGRHQALLTHVLQETFDLHPSQALKLPSSPVLLFWPPSYLSAPS